MRKITQDEFGRLELNDVLSIAGKDAVLMIAQHMDETRPMWVSYVMPRDERLEELTDPDAAPLTSTWEHREWDCLPEAMDYAGKWGLREASDGSCF